MERDERRELGRFGWQKNGSLISSFAAHLFAGLLQAHSPECGASAE
jgi:CxxC motif-containing protein (DUF1111 family)